MVCLLSIVFYPRARLSTVLLLETLQISAGTARDIVEQVRYTMGHVPGSSLKEMQKVCIAHGMEKSKNEK